MRETIVVCSHLRYINSKELIFHVFITNDLEFGETKLSKVERVKIQQKLSVVLRGLSKSFDSLVEVNEEVRKIRDSLGTSVPLTRLTFKKFLPYGKRAVAKVETKLRHSERSFNYNSWIK